VSSAPAPAPQQQAPPPAAPSEACPLCGAPLHPYQEWCLHCGAAARTRLAASPNWRAPLVGALVVAVLSLGVLAAALVKLAGDSGSGAAPRTTTLTSAPAASAPPATTPTSAVTTSTGATTPSTAPAPATAPPSAATSPVTPDTGKRLTPLERFEQQRRQEARKGK
jgi:hypothetical protein